MSDWNEQEYTDKDIDKYCKKNFGHTNWKYVLDCTDEDLKQPHVVQTDIEIEKQCSCCGNDDVISIGEDFVFFLYPKPKIIEHEVLSIRRDTKAFGRHS